MRKYRDSAASPTRIEYGIELVAGLQSFPETAPLAAPFQDLNDRLDAAYAARRGLRKPMLEARARLRFAEFEADSAIRRLSRAVEIADGGRRGPLFGELFPDGITPVVAPGGREQRAPTKHLLDRMVNSLRAGMEPLRTEQLPALQAPLDALDQAIDDYQRANEAYLDAFRTEAGLREEHLMAVDRLMGQARTAFPRDRARQDVVFPVLTRTGRPPLEAGDVGDDDDDEAAGDSGETAAAAAV